MSTAELMEAIKALPPEKQQEVENFVEDLRTKQTGEPSLAGASDDYRAAARRIFSENAELFQKLAQ